MPAEEVDSAPLLVAVHTELDKLGRWLEQDTFPARQLHIADLAMVPVLWYVDAVLGAFGTADVLKLYPRIDAWWHWVQSDPVVAETTAEMAQAYAAFAGAA